MTSTSPSWATENANLSLFLSRDWKLNPFNSLKNDNQSNSWKREVEVAKEIVEVPTVG